MESLKRPIILLDLNYTLVANSEVKLQPFTKQIEQEIYRAKFGGKPGGPHVAPISLRRSG
jgi:hypothetical protein